MLIALTILHVMIACFLVLVVLIQSGKGADIGAAFGGGSSQTVFGTRGAVTLLHKLTSGLAIGFMATSLVLAILAGRTGSRSVIPDEPAAPPARSAPAPGDQKAAPAAPAAPGEPAGSEKPAGSSEPTKP